MSSAVDVRVEDYRDVTGQFDAVLSVEMIEAVGARWWPDYFRTLEKRLAPSGRIGLQTILMAHDRLLATKASWTWIHKYIFPGGVIPSAHAIRQTLSDHTGLEVVDQMNFGESYAITLRRWRDLFDARAEQIGQLGFDRYLSEDVGFLPGLQRSGISQRLSRCGAVRPGPGCVTVVRRKVGAPW